jgi:hypothetical protein
MKRSLAFLALGLLTTATGCGDPIEGTWHSQEPGVCGVETVFTVEGDLAGSGDSCGCHFTFQLETSQPDVYTADIQAGGACALFAGTYTCTLRANDQELDCGILGNYDRGPAT